MTAASRYKVGISLVLVAATLAASAAARSAEPIVAIALSGDAHTLFIARPHTLYRADDTGRRWVKLRLPPGVPADAIAAVAVPAKRAGALYLAGSGFGVQRSADGGRSWTARNDGLPSRTVAALAVHADQPDTVYAYVPGKGVFRSEDAGAHWKWMDSGPRAGIGQLIHSNMPGSMQTGWLFAATAKGVSRSMDCFCLWQDAGALATPVDAVAFDPREPKDIYAATAEGLFLSVDGGEQWTRLNAPVARIFALAISPSGALYAGTASGDLYRSVDRAETWKRAGA